MRLQFKDSGKSKFSNAEEINFKKYLEILNYQEAMTILKIRNGMLEIKTNYINKHADLTCDMCKNEVENLKHLMTCEKYIAPAINEDPKLIWRSNGSKEEILAMSEAAKIIQKRQSEKSEVLQNSERCQDEEEDTSISPGEDKQK